MRSKLWLLCLIFLVVCFTHCRSKVVTPYDSGYSIHLATSLLQEGDLDLDEYRELIPPNDYRVIEVDGHLYSRYPVGPSVLVAPFVDLVETFSKDVFRIPFASIVQGQPAGVERLCGSLFVAATALVLFAIARQRLSVGLSLLVVFIFAFCTSSWSVVSRALWQHGPSMLFLSATLWVLLRAREEPRFAQYAGLFLAAAYTMRPTNALPVLLLTAYVALEHRAWLWRFLAWASVVAVPFLGYNLATSGEILPWYYRQPQNFDPLRWRFLEGLAGTLVSPGRGLFLYSSVLLFSLLGAVVLARSGRWSRLDSFLVLWLVGHWLSISSFANWWGGTVFGPRLFADLIPGLIYFLVPAVERLRTPGRARWGLAVGLGVTTLASFGIHRAGATDYGPWDWNIDRTHIDQDRARLWNWSDPPFLRRRSEHVIVPAASPLPPEQRKAERKRRREERRAKPPTQGDLRVSFSSPRFEEVAPL
ncbi:MAG: glycosyltransferase family 39 protein [Thermoanaerobaculia bacterium]|nr:glycosyltransferase family 39 protein [Thermoanaerobaculia bacterium]